MTSDEARAIRRRLELARTRLALSAVVAGTTLFLYAATMIAYTAGYDAGRYHYGPGLESRLTDLEDRIEAQREHTQRLSDRAY